MAQKRADLIWIARPRPGADETAARLDALGLGPDFETLVSPMIALEPVSHPRPVADFRALVFTSASALDRFTPAPGDLALPVFVVGERTAAAAREAGFTDVRVGAGDSADLAALVARSAPAKASGFWARLSYAANVLFTVRRTDRLTGAEPDAVLARAEHLLYEGDVDGALKALDGLPPKGKDASAAWRDRALRRSQLQNGLEALRAEAILRLDAARRGGAQ